MSLRQCESVLQIVYQYNQNGDASLVTYLQNSICGYDGFDMNVCCPSPRFLTTTIAPLYFFTFAPSQGGSGAATFAPIGGVTTTPNPNNNPQTFAPINFTPAPPINFSPNTVTPSATNPSNLPPAVFPTSVTSSGGIGTGSGTGIATSLPTYDANQCGVSNATHSRVVGGLPSQVNAWPWIALLGYRSGLDSVPRFLCGGSLITQRHVVTAAHCIKDSL